MMKKDGSKLGKLGLAVLVPTLALLAALAPRAYADEDEDEERAAAAQEQAADDAAQKAEDAQQKAEEAKQRAAEQRERQQEERARQQEERARQQEERQRAREQAQERAQQEKERAQEAKERAREAAEERAQQERDRAQQEKDRLQQEKERAQEAKEHAQEAKEHAREERDRARDEHDCRGKDKDDCDEGEHHEKKSGRTSAKVNGPVRFAVEVVNADVQVTAAGKDTVSISAQSCAPGDLELDGADDEFEADFSEWGSCQGPVIVVVPVGSSVEVTTVQGNLKLKGSYKEIEAKSIAGGIEIDSGDDVSVDAVQGKVKIGSVRRVEVQSVAGDVEFTTTGSAPIVDVETVSGNVRWTGTCAKGCRASLQTFQGSNLLVLDPKASSFELRFATQSGKFDDQLGALGSVSAKNVKGYAPIRAKFGKAEGTVKVETYQGNLVLKKK
jgi:flagellar motor protein MotB